MADRRYIDDMRQRLGLDDGDSRRDASIENMTATQRLELLCGWHFGDPAWARTFLSWARDAGFEIRESRQ